MIGSADPVNQSENRPAREEVTVRLVAAVKMDRIFHAERIQREIAATEKHIKDHDPNVFDRATYDGKIKGLKFALNLMEPTNG